MKYSYQTGVIVPFAQRFYKQLTIAVAGLFLATVAAMTLGASASSQTKWKAVPGSLINFSCGGIYTHTLDTVVKGEDGDFTGTGHYNPDASYTWDLNGNVTGNTFTFSILYTGTQAGSVYNATNGVINPDGSAMASVDSNCQSLTMPAGSFKQKVVKKEVDVRGNTGIENQKGAWMFNRDITTATPFEFTTAQATLHKGSLFVKPIVNNYIGAAPFNCKNPAASDQSGCNKFIGEYFAREAISNFTSFSYDFKIAGTGTSASANQFYVNIYTTLTDATNFRDCRFDYVATTGSTANFTTFSILPTSTPVNVGDPADSFTCPTTLAGMPAGSYIRAIAINVGDTGTGDTGLAAYLDKAEFSTYSKVTTYDFEPAKECKKDKNDKKDKCEKKNDSDEHDDDHDD